ncbi:somatostatin-2-like [Latimeria chalumnae]|uniref:somatostatin-2-like n=1 Tax=Latimeria chalumnae TaxID=7897 RepID=UPI0003C116E5|nr:PREDICTED: somatostatin-2-like [Latimeria chalumnae]|eukprot:XP_006001361.1 PREDICTED: somatostatin-2-like [Latimeria chalumnae]
MAWNLGVAAVPKEERLMLYDKGFGEERKQFLSNMLDALIGLNTLENDTPLLGTKEQEEHNLSERSAFKYSSLKKAPCRNFFWKTFSSC